MQIELKSVTSHYAISSLSKRFDLVDVVTLHN